MSNYRAHKNTKKFSNTSKRLRPAEQEVFYQLLSCTSDFAEAMVHSLEEIHQAHSRRQEKPNPRSNQPPNGLGGHNPRLEQWLGQVADMVANLRQDSKAAIDDLRMIMSGSHDNSRLLNNLESISKRHAEVGKVNRSPLKFDELELAFGNLCSILKQRMGSGGSTRQPSAAGGGLRGGKSPRNWGGGENSHYSRGTDIRDLGSIARGMDSRVPTGRSPGYSTRHGGPQNLQNLQNYVEDFGTAQPENRTNLGYVKDERGMQTFSVRPSVHGGALNPRNQLQTPQHRGAPGYPPGGNIGVNSSSVHLNSMKTSGVGYGNLRNRSRSPIYYNNSGAQKTQNLGNPRRQEAKRPSVGNQMMGSYAQIQQHHQRNAKIAQYGQMKNSRIRANNGVSRVSDGRKKTELRPMEVSMRRESSQNRRRGHSRGPTHKEISGLNHHKVVVEGIPGGAAPPIPPFAAPAGFNMANNRRMGASQITPSHSNLRGNVADRRVNVRQAGSKPSFGVRRQPSNSLIRNKFYHPSNNSLGASGVSAAPPQAKNRPRIPRNPSNINTGPKRVPSRGITKNRNLSKSRGPGPRDEQEKMRIIKLNIYTADRSPGYAKKVSRSNLVGGNPMVKVSSSSKKIFNRKSSGVSNTYYEPKEVTRKPGKDQTVTKKLKYDEIEKSQKKKKSKKNGSKRRSGGKVKPKETKESKKKRKRVSEGLFSPKKPETEYKLISDSSRRIEASEGFREPPAPSEDLVYESPKQRALKRLQASAIKPDLPRPGNRLLEASRENSLVKKIDARIHEPEKRQNPAKNRKSGKNGYKQNINNLYYNEPSGQVSRGVIQVQDAAADSRFVNNSGWGKEGPGGDISSIDFSRTLEPAEAALKADKGLDLDKMTREEYSELARDLSDRLNRSKVIMKAKAFNDSQKSPAKFYKGERCVSPYTPTLKSRYKPQSRQNSQESAKSRKNGKSGKVARLDGSRTRLGPGVPNRASQVGNDGLRSRDRLKKSQNGRNYEKPNIPKDDDLRRSGENGGNTRPQRSLKSSQIRSNIPKMAQNDQNSPVEINVNIDFSRYSNLPHDTSNALAYQTKPKPVAQDANAPPNHPNQATPSQPPPKPYTPSKTEIYRKKIVIDGSSRQIASPTHSRPRHQPQSPVFSQARKNQKNQISGKEIQIPNPAASIPKGLQAQSHKIIPKPVKSTKKVPRNPTKNLNALRNFRNQTDNEEQLKVTTTSRESVEAAKTVESRPARREVKIGLKLDFVNPTLKKSNSQLIAKKVDLSNSPVAKRMSSGRRSRSKTKKNEKSENLALNRINEKDGLTDQQINRLLLKNSQKDTSKNKINNCDDQRTKKPKKMEKTGNQPSNEISAGSEARGKQSGARDVVVSRLDSSPSKMLENLSKNDSIFQNCQKMKILDPTAQQRKLEKSSSGVIPLKKLTNKTHLGGFNTSLKVGSGTGNGLQSGILDRPSSQERPFRLSRPARSDLEANKRDLGQNQQNRKTPIKRDNSRSGLNTRPDGSLGGSIRLEEGDNSQKMSLEPKNGALGASGASGKGASRLGDASDLAGSSDQKGKQVWLQKLKKLEEERLEDAERKRILALADRALKEDKENAEKDLLVDFEQKRALEMRKSRSDKLGSSSEEEEDDDSLGMIDDDDEQDAVEVKTTPTEQSGRSDQWAALAESIDNPSAKQSNTNDIEATETKEVADKEKDDDIYGSDSLDDDDSLGMIDDEEAVLPIKKTASVAEEDDLGFLDDDDEDLAGSGSSDSSNNEIALPVDANPSLDNLDYLDEDNAEKEAEKDSKDLNLPSERPQPSKGTEDDYLNTSDILDPSSDRKAENNKPSNNDLDYLGGEGSNLGSQPKAASEDNLDDLYGEDDENQDKDDDLYGDDDVGSYEAPSIELSDHNGGLGSDEEEDEGEKLRKELKAEKEKKKKERELKAAEEKKLLEEKKQKEAEAEKRRLEEEERERIRKEEEEREKRLEQKRKKLEEQRKKREEQRKKEELKRKMQPDKEDLFLKLGRQVQDLPERPRLYEPVYQEVQSVSETEKMFGKFNTSLLDIGQANGYRIAFGLAGVVVYGGEFLSIAKMEETGKLTSIIKDDSDSTPAMKIKLLNDGNIAYVDPFSHDIVKINHKMKELERLSGNPVPQSYKEAATGFFKGRRSSFVDESRNILWMNGMNHLSYLDTETWKATVVPNFWQQGGGWCFAQLAVADKEFGKFCGYGFNGAHMPTLHFYDRKRSKFSSKLAKETIKIPEIKAIEVSLEQDVVFLAGGLDDVSGVPQIAAVTFDPDLKLITQTQIEPESLSCIFCLRRLKEGNVLFAAGYSSIAVIFYKDGVFTVASVIEDVMNDEIYDMEFYDGSLYAISPAQPEIAQVRFPGYQFKLKVGPRLRPNVSLSSMFDLHVKKHYPLEEKCHYLKISQTGQILYLGIDNFLKVATKDADGKFVTKNLPSSHMRFLEMKEIEGKYLGYSDTETNKFYLMNFNLEQVARLNAKGFQTISSSLNPYINCHSSSHDEHIFLWLMGDTKVGVIDTHADNYEIVDGLGGVAVDQSLAHCVKSTDNGRRIVSLTTRDDTDVDFINYWRRGAAAVVTKPVNMIDISVDSMISLEISNDQTILFGACKTKEGDGALLAFSFDQYFDILSKELYQGQPLSTMIKLKKSDLLLVGAGSRLIIVNYLPHKFRIVRNFFSVFENQSITRLSLHNNELVILGEKGDSFVHMHFKNNIGEIVVEGEQTSRQS